MQIIKIWVTVNILPNPDHDRSLISRNCPQFVTQKSKIKINLPLAQTKTLRTRLDRLRKDAQYYNSLAFRKRSQIYEELGFRLLDVGFNICIILICLAYSFLSRRSLLIINGMTTRTIAILTRMLAMNKYSHRRES